MATPNFVRTLFDLSISYTAGFAEAEKSFDLLISQYAGFVSQHCKKYLKIGGILLVNNSHGDASMAKLDDDYKFVGGDQSSQWTI